MSAAAVRVSPAWLELREPADAAARSAALAERLARHLGGAGRLVIHDLGGGSGAMGRWLAPRLPGPQHWVVHDRDADLLELAVAEPPAATADGAAITVEARRSDIARLAPRDLAGAGLVTASAPPPRRWPSSSGAWAPDRSSTACARSTAGRWRPRPRSAR